MSTSIDNAFVKQYETDVKHVFQRQGSIFRNAARHKPNVVGTSTTFQKVGRGTATTKARHGLVTPMNQEHTPVACTLADFYAGDYVDKLDEAKTSINEREVIARGGAMALGRKIDDQIMTALDTTTQSAVTLTVTSRAAILASLLTFVEALYANDVPNDGMLYGALTPRMWSQAMTVEAFSKSDYVGFDGLPFKEGAPIGKWKDWMGVKWTMHTGLPGRGTASAKCFLWHRDAVGYASAKSAGNLAGNEAVAADIQWIGPRVAHWVNHMMSGGACLIDDSGVIEGTVNDTTAIATS
jgi:hypothetical protein